MRDPHIRTYRCPYCYEDFNVWGEESDDVAMAPDCGHSFTLGEARRGRPDPANQNQVETLIECVRQLTARVEALETRLGMRLP